MFKDVTEMSLEELEEELEAIEQLSSVLNDVNVNSLLAKEIDLDCLKKLDVCVTPNGQLFRVDNQRLGFLAEIMETMFNDRSSYKNKQLALEEEIEKIKAGTATGNITELEAQVAQFKNMQLALKVGLNSAYGAMGNEYFRFFDVRYASAITTAAQLSIRWIAQKINAYLDNLLKKKKDRIVASDTDSVYVVLDDLVKAVMPANAKTEEIVEFLNQMGKTKMQDLLNNSYQELADYLNAYAQKMKMKREAIAEVGIWTAKKRYALLLWDQEGVRYAEPQIKVTGLEVVQSTTPAFCRDGLKKCIKLCMTTDEASVQSYIQECREKFKKLSAEEIGSPSGMNGLEKYSDEETIFSKGTPGHVKGSLLYNDLIKKKGLDKKFPLINDGEKVKYVYLRVPNPVREDKISFPGRLPKELGMHQYIDYETQFEKTFFSPIEKFMKCIGWRAEKSSSLEAFFGED